MARTTITPILTFFITQGEKQLGMRHGGSPSPSRLGTNQLACRLGSAGVLAQLGVVPKPPKLGVLVESPTSAYVTISWKGTGCSPVAFNLTYYAKPTPERITTALQEMTSVIHGLSPDTHYVFVASSLCATRVGGNAKLEETAPSKEVTIHTFPQTTPPPPKPRSPPPPSPPGPMPPPPPLSC